MAQAGSSSVDKYKRHNSQEEDVMSEPLDLLRINVPRKDKTTKIVSALSIGFMEAKEYVSYIPLPSLILGSEKSCDSADEEEWVQRIAYLENDLIWLLKLPHHRFWSQVMYDENLQKCLQTYLSHSPRSYELNFDAKKELLDHQNRIHKLVFLVFLRMSTHKESKKHHITPSVFGNLIYDNFIFDIPRMFDLCILYGFKNQAIVSKMINNLFANQAKFLDDLDEACVTIMLAFDSVEEQLQSLGRHRTDPNDLMNGESYFPLTLSGLYELLDIVNYILDISATLYMFIECFSKSSSLFLKHGASTRISHFYDSTLADIQNEVERSDCEGQEGILNILHNRISLSKTFFIRAFRNILSGCIQETLNAKFANLEDTSHQIHVESYLQVTTEIIMGTIFKHDYNQVFPIDDDLDLFEKAGIFLDPDRINYILMSMDCEKNKQVLNSNQASSAAGNAIPKNPSAAGNAIPKNTSADKSVTNLEGLAALLSSSNLNAEGATSLKSEESKLLSQIQYVADVFGDRLGEGFIEACLEHYDYDLSSTVNALLSESLPEHLAKADKNMKRKTQNPVPSDGGTQSILSERRSIFDNDEFDVFNQEVPMDRIHFGKNNKTPNVYEILNESKDSALLKELTLKYGTDDKLSKYEQNVDLYDDEYDDTYDSTEVSVLEHEAEDELLKIRPFTAPRVLDTHPKHEEDEITEELEDQADERPETRDSRGDFCENPEITRQRYQQRREAKQMNRNRHQPPRDTESSNKPSNFHNKDRHKANVANHSRRKQSDYKRSRGMMPS